MKLLKPLRGMMLLTTAVIFASWFTPERHVVAATPADAVVPDQEGPRANYVLAANDLIGIRVFQEDDLETRVRISKDGTITFPLIGAIRVGGKTPQEAARTIRDLLAKGYLINPQVTVSVLEYTKYRLTVLGQVQKPGSYDFPDRERLSLLEAIGMAGGYTRIADPGKIVVKRISNGKESVYRVNAKKMASRVDASAFEVLPGDVITVGESIF
jgi:protein involved in polysaccharide export with SLBB domain